MKSHRHSEFAWPKISVVTPSFNQGEFLEECIDSVLSQGYSNLEYIILDGGSTDQSVEIIRKYEKYLTYWRSQPDSGQYSAISEALNRSTGEVMTWINSDDRFFSGAFQIVALLFSRRPEIQWLTGRPNGFGLDKDSRWLAEPLPSWSREQFLRKEYRKPYLQQEGTFWRRSLWDKAGAHLRSDLQMAGDLELWVRFFRHSQLHVVDSLLASFRSHEHQKSTKGLDLYGQEADAVLTQEASFFKQQPIQQTLPPPAAIPLSEVLALMEEHHPLLHGFRRLVEHTNSSLTESRELNRFLKKHWWTKLGRNLGLVRIPRFRKQNDRGIH